MKGIVFNLLEEVVRREHGEDTWDDLLHTAGLDGAYTSLGSYDDGQMFKIVAAAADALKVSQYDVVRWFGRKALPLLANKYPGLFSAHTDTRSFVLALTTSFTRKSESCIRAPTSRSSTTTPRRPTC